MRRLGIAALWVASIAVTWQVVKATTASEPAVAQAPVAHERAGARALPRPVAAVRAPSLALENAAEPADDRVFQAALATLERDLADGRWGAADRDRLNTALPRVTGPQAEQLLAVLFPRLNEGSVKSELDGPPI